jgi:predicted extracellular nuclease
MSKTTTPLRRGVLLLSLIAAGAAHADVQITEWMYSGSGGEFIEFTNLGSSPVDFTGWVYDDDSRLNSVALGAFSLGALGILAPGQSAIITESSAAAFRAAWNLAESVPVLGGTTNNIGRADEINLFDAAGNLVDRFAYGDAVFPGTVRTQNFSGTPRALADLVPQNVTTGWVLAATGDAFGSYASASGDIGNPGQFTLAVPEPGSVALMLAGLGLVAVAARRRA